MCLTACANLKDDGGFTTADTGARPVVGLLCPVDAGTNECGGCMRLYDKPMAACGLCGGGTFVCDGTEATKCNDPVVVPPDTPCGICSKSRVICNPEGTTTCPLPDDRFDTADDLYLLGGSQDSLHRSDASAVYRYALSFHPRRTAYITGFTLGLYRTDHDLGVTDPGTIQIRLIKGTPTLTPAASDVLANISLSGDAIDPAPPHEVHVALKEPTASFAVGTPFYVELTHDSVRFDYQISGNIPKVPSEVDWHAAAPGDAAYSTVTAFDPRFTIEMKTCD